MVCKVINTMGGPRLMLLSNSKLHGQEWFDWCSGSLKAFFEKSSVKDVLFIPYAIKEDGYDGYVDIVRPGFKKLGLNVEGIQTKKNPVTAVQEAQAIFVGGGNTFLLLKTLYENNLIEPIRERVLNNGIPYVGSSAGTNVATRSINTTNDMPICFPSSFEALKLVPFNINPHYIDAEANSTHMGETREQRIQEFLEQPDCAPVLGLREGSYLLVENDKATVGGIKAAILFQKGQKAINYETGSDVTFLLNGNC
ncbi:hypothetical protein JTE90_024337 [Oedothorax gibbosus]|uniref:dipeptidase E n=1 Tax=Oedothorax gibbosus TaxID=931172 RepID=A0AAV6W120_9ARAC|nr:hypothetical protein JTE90_024337 [Oedothorax gibbosus]